MKKGVFLYKSKYGSSKWYAEKIAGKCEFECKDLKYIKIFDIQKYEIIIFCKEVYASGVSFRKFLNKNYERIKGKKIILFVNGASPFDEKTLKNLICNYFKKEITFFTFVLWSRCVGY